MSSLDTLSRWEEKLAEFERLIDDYFRRDLFEELPTKLNEAISGANDWIKEIESGTADTRDAFNEQVVSLNALTREIEALSEELERDRPDPEDVPAVDAYNARVRECNEKISMQKEMHASVDEARRAYESQSGERNEEVKRRQDELAKRQGQVRERLHALQQWFERKGPEKFFRELNGIFTEVKRFCRDSGGQEEHQAVLERLREMRRELGTIARRNASDRDDGMLMVDAVVCDEERCTLTVDTGSTITTLSPQMVEALGLEDEVGREVELTLPAGITIKAPQLLIPSLTVHGHEAKYVKGVVLKETTCGVDGSLGQSFLNRFDYHVGGRTDRTLTLQAPAPVETRPAVEGDSGGDDQFDVFISHKTEDRDAADAVYELLEEAGYKVFYSPVSVPRSGAADFGKTIDRALEMSRHLVVVASCREHLEEPWVRAEWSLFENLRRSGRKPKANIVNVLDADFTSRDLPVALSRFFAIHLNDANWKTQLVGFLPR